MQKHHNSRAYMVLEHIFASLNLRLAVDDVRSLSAKLSIKHRIL